MIGTTVGVRHERLPPDAGSARRARSLVAEVLEDAGFHDLADVALLLVSEMVTNAVLHAATEVELLVVVEEDRLRIEVRDGSPVLPGVRHYDEAATTGRGMGLVELLATTWGVEPQAAGKTVWCTLRRGAARDEQADHDEQQAPVPADGARAGFTVRFLSLPVQPAWAAIQQGDAVLREVALVAISGRSDPDLPEWHGTGIDLSPILDPIEAAIIDGRASIDLDATFPSGADAGARNRRDLIDGADRIAAEGRLPSARPLPEVARVRHWLLGEIVAQATGARPKPYTSPDGRDDLLATLDPV